MNRKRNKAIILSALAVSFLGSLASPLLASICVHAATTTATTTLNARVISTLNISVPDTIRLGSGAVSPTPTGNEVTGSGDVIVTTNSLTYQLLLTSYDSDTFLKHSNAAVSDKIESTTGVGTALAADKWGWRLSSEGSSSYHPIMARGTAATTGKTVVKSNGTTTNGSDSTTVVFGAKISTKLAAGDYSRKVMFTAIVPDSGE